LAYDKNLISFFRFEDIRTPERGPLYLPQARHFLSIVNLAGDHPCPHAPRRNLENFVSILDRGNYFSFGSKERLLDEGFLKNFIDFTFLLCIINVIGSVWQYYKRNLEIYLINRSGLTVKLVDVACSFLQQYFALVGKNNLKKYLL